MIRAAALLVALWAGAAAAQGLPAPAPGAVSDFAAVLDRADAVALDQALGALRADTGVQGAVVTVARAGAYGRADVETLARDLFNAWGVGDAMRNDGFMVLVAVDDRAARIALGAGYTPEADIIAQAIMAQTMLPAFRAGDLSRGIRAGTQDVIDHIARPVAAGAEPQAPARRGWHPLVVLAGFAAFIAAHRLWRRRARRAGSAMAAGQGGAAGRDAPDGPGPDGGRGDAGGFGGGQSSGGGASGRW